MFGPSDVGEAVRVCILFVEDETLIQMVAEDVFQDAGFEVLVAENASNAVRLIDCHPGRFSCLVSDLRMPGRLSGIDLIEHARGRYPAMPMFLATGTPGDVPLTWLARHEVDLICKPYSLEWLVNTIEGKLFQAKTTASASPKRW